MFSCPFYLQLSLARHFKCRAAASTEWAVAVLIWSLHTKWQVCCLFVKPHTVFCVQLNCVFKVSMKPSQNVVSNQMFALPLLFNWGPLTLTSKVFSELHRHALVGRKTKHVSLFTPVMEWKHSAQVETLSDAAFHWEICHSAKRKKHRYLLYDFRLHDSAPRTEPAQPAPALSA